MTDRLDEMETIIAEAQRTRKIVRRFDSAEQFAALQQAADNWNVTVTFLADRGWPRDAVTPERIAGAFMRRPQLDSDVMIYNLHEQDKQCYDPGLPDMSEATDSE